MDKNNNTDKNFVKNVEYSDTLGKRYDGKFVAIYKQKVIGSGISHDKLWNKIKKYQKSPELYVSYIHSH